MIKYNRLSAFFINLYITNPTMSLKTLGKEIDFVDFWEFYVPKVISFVIDMPAFITRKLEYSLRDFVISEIYGLLFIVPVKWDDEKNN